MGTRIIARLRWHLHELHTGWTPPTKLERDSAFDKVHAHLSRRNDGAIGRRLALRLEAWPSATSGDYDPSQ
jgi:transposase